MGPGWNRAAQPNLLVKQPEKREVGLHLIERHIQVRRIKARYGPLARAREFDSA
jgi:hypothetical protein